MITRPLVLLKSHIHGAAEINRRLIREHRAEVRADARREARDGGQTVKCALCSETFQRFRPWSDQITPIQICHRCSRGVPVRMCADWREGGLGRVDAAKWGSVFSAIRTVIWHLEKELE